MPAYAGRQEAGKRASKQHGDGLQLAVPGVVNYPIGVGRWPYCSARAPSYVLPLVPPPLSAAPGVIRMTVITSVDLTGIQRFVFASNRLVDVAGGSGLVRWAGGRDLLEHLVANPGDATPTHERVIFASGGNALLRFDDPDQARDFAARYSRRLLEDARGLEAAIAHDEIDGGIARAMIDVGERMRVVKAERLPQAPLLGLGVTASCRETGLAATAPPPNAGARDRVPLAAGVRARRKMGSSAQAQWDDFLPTSGWAFPTKLDDLGRTWGDRSLIGVVHIDANGVGGRVVDWLERQARESRPDDEVVDRFKAWSESLAGTMAAALRAAIARVTRGGPPAIIKGRPRLGGEGRLGFDLRDAGDDCSYLPIRPILLGGDDLTFVCDGRIALDLAAAALGVFPAQDLDGGATIGACAGVAIVRSHHPFARAYGLAEQLCRSAKDSLVTSGAQTACALDWLINAPAPGASIEGIRGTGAGPRLTCRPYRIDRQGASWPWLRDDLIEHTLRGEEWSGSRGKVKELLTVVTGQGADGVRDALARWQVVNRNLALPPLLDADGFLDAGTARATPLVDAIELLDIHIPLSTPGAT